MVLVKIMCSYFRTDNCHDGIGRNRSTSSQTDRQCIVQVHRQTDRQTDSVYRTVEREELSRNEPVILHVLQ